MSNRYLIRATYTHEGHKGLHTDHATGRRNAIGAACESLSGKLHEMYFTLGEEDVIAIVEMPDTQSITALTLAIARTGMVHTKTTPILTVEETDRAIQKSTSIQYKAPGQSPHSGGSGTHGSQHGSGSGSRST